MFFYICYYGTTLSQFFHSIEIGQEIDANPAMIIHVAAQIQITTEVLNTEVIFPNIMLEDKLHLTAD